MNNHNHNHKAAKLSLATNINAVLALLPKRDFDRLLPHLQAVELGFMETLYEPLERMRYLYFLQDGVASIVAPFENGSEVEVGMVGPEGVVGGSLLMGVDRGPNRTFIQLPGRGHRIKAEAMLRLFNENGTIQQSLLHAVQAYSVQVEQTAACNRAHNIEERLARWLLMSHDRMGDRAENPPVPITHELMSRMLGARRSTVTIAAGLLQRGNFIRYQRGLVKIMDRKGLEDVACECYSIVRTEADRLMRNGSEGRP